MPPRKARKDHVIPLPDGDHGITSEALQESWDISDRDRRRMEAESPGLPTFKVGGRKYHPERRAGEWLLRTRLKESNPPRRARAQAVKKQRDAQETNEQHPNA